jgi:hypothetical protein
MSSYETRLQRLEAQRRQPWPVGHCMPVVFSPRPLGEPDEHDWLRARVCPWLVDSSHPWHGCSWNSSRRG